MSRRREVSAGGLVFSGGKLLVLRTRHGHWVFPKGNVEPGESLEETAVREVREETGLAARITRALGQTRYRYTLGRGPGRVTVDKTVHWFAMEHVSGTLAVNRAEGFEAGQFVDPHEAMRLLTYDAGLVRRYLAQRAQERERPPM